LRQTQITKIAIKECKMKRYEPLHYSMAETPEGRYIRFDEVNELLDKIKAELTILKQKLLEMK
jgi:hypothetical protein